MGSYVSRYFLGIDNCRAICVISLYWKELDIMTDFQKAKQEILVDLYEYAYNVGDGFKVVLPYHEKLAKASKALDQLFLELINECTTSYDPPIIDYEKLVEKLLS